MQGGAGTQALERLAEVWSRRKWLGLALFSLAAPAGVTVALSLPSIYRSTATVVVDRARTDSAGTSELESRLQLIRQEILSRSRLEVLIRALDLYPTLRQHASMEDLVGRIRREIQTESKLQPQPSGIGTTVSLAISCRGTNPDVVAKVANAVALLYIEEDHKIRERQASGATHVLKAQLDEVKRNLQKQEGVLGAFQSRHVGELPQQSEANMANLGRLHADLRTVSEERIRALDRRNEVLKELAERDSGSSAAGSGPAPAPVRLARKKEELADLSRRYTDKYPEIIRLKEDIASLEQETAQAAPGAAAAGDPGRLRESLRELEGEIQALKYDEAHLRAKIAEYILRLENAPQRQQDFQRIARDYQTTRDLYDSLRKRYEQAQLEEGDGGLTGSSSFRILEPALVPTGAVAPNRLALLFVALAGALGIAAAAATLAEWLDTSFHSAADVRSFTRVPVVADIPQIVSAGDQRARRRRAFLAAMSLLLGIGVLVPTVHRVARTSEGVVLMLAKGRP